jgi:hypothetical protein
MRTKDVLSIITETSTLIFKVIIFGIVMLTMVSLKFNFIVIVLAGIVGVLWTLGHKNVMVLYYLFKNRGKDG